MIEPYSTQNLKMKSAKTIILKTNVIQKVSLEWNVYKGVIRRGVIRTSGIRTGVV